MGFGKSDNILAVSSESVEVEILSAPFKVIFRFFHLKILKIKLERKYLKYVFIKNQAFKKKCYSNFF